MAADLHWQLHSVQAGYHNLLEINLKGLSHIPIFVLILIICTIINFLTELTSNTATTQMILPILASVSVAIGVNPLLLMIAATLISINGIYDAGWNTAKHNCFCE
ncbi:MAG: anion permease [Ignavibacteriales bacterium]|nr:anion permease [Ignavibacteriales bacterium]